MNKYFARKKFSALEKRSVFRNAMSSLKGISQIKMETPQHLIKQGPSKKTHQER